MPLTPRYRPTEPPDSPQIDSDSDADLDLELEELDPASKSRAHGSRLLSKESKPEKRAPPIALRNLRMSGLRRSAKRDRDQSELGHDRIGGESHISLVEDERDDLRYSDGSGIGGGDDAPLLRQRDAHSRRRSSAGGLQVLSKMRSSLRLPVFMSGHSAIRQDDEEEDDAADLVLGDPSSSRIVAVGAAQAARYPPNLISNAKYTAFTFLPVTLYNEFSFFFNLYFLLVALSQAIPALRIGYLTTYIAPLAFVLVITMGKEAYDDIERRRRDSEANSETYTVLDFNDAGRSSVHRRTGSNLILSSSQNRHTRRFAQRDRFSDIREEEERAESDGSNHLTSHVYEVSKKSRDLKVGDVLKLGKGQRVPADVIILKCSLAEASQDRSREADLGSLLADTDGISADDHANVKVDVSQDSGGSSSGETFIKTDQLDGETDWKLRVSSALTQSLPVEEFTRIRVIGGKPDKKVNEFIGTVEILPPNNTPGGRPSSENMADLGQSAPLSIDNTAWANTIIASQVTTMAVVVYTGPQTRSALSTAPSRSKTGLLEYEINSLTKILCALTLALSIILVALEGFSNTEGNVWYVKITRFLVLFSTIVPISLRVNLDMGKSVYSWFIQRDADIRGAVVRTSTIPEDLGRIEYLLSDKTGTLTQNEMEMKKIHVGTVSYANEAMDEVAAYVRQGFGLKSNNGQALVMPSSTQNVAAGSTVTRTRREIGSRVRDVVLALALCHNVTPTLEEESDQTITSYQASSPDEIAIVRWTESVGLRLRYRDRKGMVLESTDSGKIVVQVRILDVFPFTSDGKRMGIIVKFDEYTQASSPRLDNGEIWFYQKGADTVMGSIVAANDWLDEETANMAREGLRTLVVGRKRLSPDQYREFSTSYQEAALVINGREASMQRVIAHFLENGLELLGVTGVEDKLQKDVKPSLELLRNAGIKIWMLTGDKVETARCVAVSSKLVARGQYIYTVTKLKRKDNAQDHLDFLRSKPDSCLLIDGESLSLFLTHFGTEFISVAVKLPTVVACRCSPTQKADIAKLIKGFTKKRVCCIGDGGNDVSMIQAADVGVGIVGKEGRQASLAADFSIEHFCHLTKLLVWHGRNSYKRSAKLAQFVIHRGLIIAVCQTVYSIAIKFEPDGLYKDWLLVGYATVYTAAPVLSLVLDRDVNENVANLYPELYKELTSGRSLSYRTFFVWVLVSIYQGSIIQGLSQILTEVDGKRMVAVSYTVLVLNELLMVAVEITTWHLVMILCIIGTFFLYIGSIPFLGLYFDLGFVSTWGFLWRVLAISSISLIPPYVGKVIRRTMKPPSYRKVQGI
ncbi:phospholipid-translocating P-type ATPase [Xylaria nigripes]|nr:phospholipid-translocating P-type ATPase [Xylaria nigripes]